MAAPTIASAIPVLPEVESRMTLPGRRSPRARPSSIILRAARSFTEPPGLKPSSLAKMRTPGRSRPSVSRVISSSGVLPMRSSTLRARAAGTDSRLTSAGNRRDDGDIVAILDLGAELVEEADVVAVQIDVHEAAQFAGVVHQTLAHPGVAAFEILDNGLDRIAFGSNFIDAGSEAAQRGGDSNPDSHDSECNLLKVARANFDAYALKAAPARSCRAGQRPPGTAEPLVERVEFAQARLDNEGLLDGIGHRFESFVAIACYAYHDALVGLDALLGNELHGHGKRSAASRLGENTLGA